MKRASFVPMISSLVAMTALGCGGDDPAPIPAGTCEQAAAGAACFDALLAEARECMGGVAPLVTGTMSMGNEQCIDDTDPSRVVTFSPALDADGHYGSFTVSAGGTECVTVTDLNGVEWGREITTASGTAAITWQDEVIDVTCPDGTSASFSLGAYGECEEKVSVAEAFGSGGTLSYNWQDVNWYRCTETL